MRGLRLVMMRRFRLMVVGRLWLVVRRLRMLCVKISTAHEQMVQRNIP